MFLGEMNSADDVIDDALSEKSTPCAG